MKNKFAMLASLLLAMTTLADAADKPKVATPTIKFKLVDVTLPNSDQIYPPGKGADTTNAYCLMCHSAEMALLQPPLSEKEWTAEVNKMRTAFGAPIPPEQVGEIAHYLSTVNGRNSDNPKPIDSQGS
jgi:hypothetical protein